MAISTKNFTSIWRQFRGNTVFTLMLILCCSILTADAQQPIQRLYANSVEKSADDYLLIVKAGYVTDAQKAVDGNTQTAATLHSTVVNLLGIKIGGSSSIRLRFTGADKPTAGVPVTIKLGSGNNLLSILSGLTIQAIKGSGNTKGEGNEVGPVYAGSSLINLLGGEEQTEFTFTPTVDYDGVKISLKSPNGLLSVGALATAKVYHAYFTKPASGSICEQPIDVLYGSTGNIAGALNPVDDAAKAIDGNESTAAILRANVSLLNRTYLTGVFPSLSMPGDSIRLIIQPQNTGLLDATLLSSNFSVKTFNDNADNGTLALQTQLLGLRLLGGTLNKYVVTYPVTDNFNRIQISLGAGLVNALNGLLVYEVARKAPTPIISAPGIVGNTLTLCEGQPVTFQIANPEIGAHYKWFNAATGGNEIINNISANGATFTPQNLSPGTFEFYVAVFRNGCSDQASERAKVKVVVKQAAQSANIQASGTTICLGQIATLAAPTLSNPGDILNPVFTWYFDQNKADMVTSGTFSGVTYTINPDGSLNIQGLTQSKNYFLGVQGAERCENIAGNLKEVSVNIDAPIAPTINLAGTQIIGLGGNISLSVSPYNASGYQWFKNGNLIIGQTTSTLAIANATIADAGIYTVTATSVGGCTSPQSTPVTIQIAGFGSTKSVAGLNNQGKIDAGAELTYTVTVSNTGNTDMTSITISDPIPANTTYVVGSADNSGVLTGNTLNWTVNVPAGQELAVNFKVRVSNDLTGITSIGNIATVTNPADPGNPQSPEVPPTPTNQISDFAVSSMVASSSLDGKAHPGDMLTYTISITNTGSVELNNLTIVNPLPNKTSFDNAANGGIYNAPTNTINFTLPNLAVGAAKTLTFTVRADNNLNNVAVISNTANVNFNTISKATTAVIAVVCNTTTIANLTVNGSSGGNICSNSPTAKIVATASGVTNASYYLYEGANLVLFNNTGIFDISISPNMTYSYTVGISADGFCETPVADRALITFKTEQIPTIPSILTADVRVCEGSSAVFAIENPDANLTYQWFAEASGGTALATGPVFTSAAITTDQSFYVETISAAGCTSVRSQVTVSVATPSTPLLNVTGVQTVATGNDVTLEVSPIAASSYQWFKDGELIVGQTSSSLVLNNVDAAAAGNYTAIAASIEGCMSAMSLPVILQVEGFSTSKNVTGLNAQGKIDANAELTFTISVKNTGSVAMTGILISDPIPANTAYVVGSADNSGVLTGNTLNWTVNVPAGQELAVNFRVKVINDLTGITSIGNIATVTNPGNPGNPQNPEVLPTPTNQISDFAVTSTVASSSSDGKAHPGDILTYTISVSNTGSVELKNITIANPLPNNTSFNNANNGGMFDSGTNTINFNLTNLAVGSTKTVSFTVIADKDLTNVSTINNTSIVKHNANEKAANVTIDVVCDTVATADIYVNGGSGGDICVNSNSISVTATAPALSNPIFYLYDGTNKIAQNTSGLFTLNTSIGTTYNLSVSVSADGYCETPELDRKSITFKVNSIPSAPVVSAALIYVCSGTSPILAIASPQTDVSYKWYDIAVGGNSIGSGANFTPPPINANTIFYVESINSAGCMSQRTEVRVETTVPPLAPTDVTAASNSLCSGSTTILSVVNPDPALRYRWYNTVNGGTMLSEGSSFTSPTLTATTTFYVESVAISGCVSLARKPFSIIIQSVLPAPVVTVASKTASSVTFKWLAVPGAESYEVRLGDANSWIAVSGGANGLTYTVNNLSPTKDVTISVRARGSLECQTSAASIPTTGEADNPLGNEIFIPNTFTPNNDGTNDTFTIFGNTIAKLKLRIFNQWGQLIFESLSQSNGWDGTYRGQQQPVGVYVYYLDLTFNDSTSTFKKGTITILR